MHGCKTVEKAFGKEMSEKHISKLINGDVQLALDVAVRLEMVIGVMAKFWNNLEAVYREKMVKAEAESAMDAAVQLENNFHIMKWLNLVGLGNERHRLVI